MAEAASAGKHGLADPGEMLGRVASEHRRLLALLAAPLICFLLHCFFFFLFPSHSLLSLPFPPPLNVAAHGVLHCAWCSADMLHSFEAYLGYLPIHPRQRPVFFLFRCIVSKVGASILRPTLLAWIESAALFWP